MKFTMKSVLKSVTVSLGVAVLAASPAQSQVSSVSDLLNKVRQDAAKQQSINAQREQEFNARRDQQASLLAEAKRELNGLESKARSVQSNFDANTRRIDQLKGDLKTQQGEFGEVFGLARSKAGEFKATLDSSLITAEYPERTALLGEISDSDALPSTDELNAIWKSMLGEIQAQREVKSFTAPVANLKDGGTEATVTRVGPFTVFTKDGGNFLEYSAPKNEGEIPLTYLERQPGGTISKAAKTVAGAGAGSMVFGPVDPTRGSLTKALERVPNFTERFGNGFLFKPGYGGVIGIIIWWLTFLGIVFGILNILRLAKISMSVKSQKKSAQPSKGNPLGRIMLAYDSVKDRDEEVIELKLDEAILRESPKLDFGLNILKLGAGIAPLLGLLGTVTGMIKTFQAMMIYGAGDPQLMAGGISEALITTMMGLVAAIPLLILHSFCASLARGVQSTLEEQSAGIVARHAESTH